jgi:hypothetical protein
MSRPKLSAAVTAALEERQTHTWELRCLIQCLETAEIAHESGAANVEDLSAALRGLVTFADHLHESLDAETFAEGLAEREADAAREAAKEARQNADEAAERRATGRTLRAVVSGTENEQ